MAAGYIANIIASHSYDVSTHSHAKAAEDGFYVNDRCEDVSTHSRAKAAGASSKKQMRQGLLTLVSLSYHKYDVNTWLALTRI